MMFEQLDRYRQEAPLGAWASKIALSRSLMFLRSPWHRARLSFGREQRRRNLARPSHFLAAGPGPRVLRCGAGAGQPYPDGARGDLVIRGGGLVARGDRPQLWSHGQLFQIPVGPRASAAAGLVRTRGIPDMRPDLDPLLLQRLRDLPQRPAALWLCRVRASSRPAQDTPDAAPAALAGRRRGGAGGRLGTQAWAGAAHGRRNPRRPICRCPLRRRESRLKTIGRCCCPR